MGTPFEETLPLAPGHAGRELVRELVVISLSLIHI